MKYTKLIKEFETLSYDVKDILFRLDDLNIRLSELKESSCYWEGMRINDEELRYTQPDDIFKISDCVRAIDIAKEDLRNHYGLEVTSRSIKHISMAS